MTKISTTQVCALLKRVQIKTTAKELKDWAVDFGMYKEHRINNLGGAMVYYWVEKGDIERLKIGNVMNYYLSSNTKTPRLNSIRHKILTEHLDF